MKVAIYSAQLLAIQKMIQALKEFEARRFGLVSNITFMVHFMIPNAILVKYEKKTNVDGQLMYEFKICQVNVDGSIEYIDKNFHDVFARSAFLSECEQFDIENPAEYIKKD